MACSMARAAWVADGLAWVSPSQSSIMAVERIMAVGLAMPWPAMSGAVPWLGWKTACLSPMSAEGAKPMPPIKAGAEVGEDVAEEVLGGEDVEVPGAADEVERHGVDVVVAGVDVGVAGGGFVEDPAHEGEGAEDVGFVDQGDLALGAAGGPAAAGEVAAEFGEAFGGGAGDDLGVAGFLVVDDLALAAGGEHAFGGFADDDEVDGSGAGVGECGGDAGDGADGADAGEEAVCDAHVELRGDFGAVGVADVGPAHGAEEDGVGLARAFEAVGGEDGAGFLVVVGAALDGFGAEG